MPALATLPFASLAEKSGVDVDTLKNYERLGLLSKPRRPASGLILYPADEDRRVTFIKRSFELGFSADAIREMVSLGAQGRRAARTSMRSPKGSSPTFADASTTSRASSGRWRR